MSRFAGRPLDRIWFFFFVWHIPISLLLDLQALYPSSIHTRFPFLAAFTRWYISWSRDPIIIGVGSGAPQWAWLKTFFWLEGCFQLPCFILGAYGLYYNDKRVYPLLLAYGASTATTLVPVLSALLDPKIATPRLTSSELGALLGSYVPFLFIPLGIAADMGWRIVRVLEQAQARKAI